MGKDVHILKVITLDGKITGGKVRIEKLDPEEVEINAKIAAVVRDNYSHIMASLKHFCFGDVPDGFDQLAMLVQDIERLKAKKNED